MEPDTRLSRDHLYESPLIWDRKFSVRRQHTYLAEDNRLAPGPQQTIFDAFLQERRELLRPLQYSYAALRMFVASARLSDLTAPTTPAEHTTRLVLLDDRRDASGGARSTRNWDGYRDYPPEGERQWSAVLNAAEFYRRLIEKVMKVLCKK